MTAAKTTQALIQTCRHTHRHTCVKAIIHTDIKINNATELMILLYDFTNGMKIQK